MEGGSVERLFLKPKGGSSFPGRRANQRLSLVTSDLGRRSVKAEKYGSKDSDKKANKALKPFYRPEGQHTLPQP